MAIDGVATIHGELKASSFILTGSPTENETEVATLENELSDLIITETYSNFVNSGEHTLAVLVLCIFCTCRAVRLLRFFSHGVRCVKFLCTPVPVCLKGP